MRTRAAAKAVHDLYPSSTLRGGKAEQLAMIPYLSHGLLTQADADAAAAKTVHDPFPSSALQRGVAGDEIAFANAIVTAADSLHDPVTESLATSEQFVPGVTDFPTGLRCRRRLCGPTTGRIASPTRTSRPGPRW